MALKITAIILLLSISSLAQYRVINPGSGPRPAFIAENTASGQPTCYQFDATATTNSFVFDPSARVCAKATTGVVTSNELFIELPTDLIGGTIDTAFFQANQLIWRNWLSLSSSAAGNAMIASNAYLDFNSNTINATNTAASTGAAAILLNSQPGSGQSIIFARLSGATIADQPISMTETARFDTNGNFIPGTNNVGTIGSQSKAWNILYSSQAAFGHPASIQGNVAFYNNINASFFQMSGGNSATGGGDLAVGGIIGPNAIYPVNISTDLGLNGTPGRFRKIWVKDIDISGTCTGCISGASANTFLSNLTSPTNINQSLQFDTDNNHSIGAFSKELQNIYSTNFDAGSSTRAGEVNIYNGASATPNILIGANATGNSDIQIGALFQTGWALYPISNIVGDLGISANRWRKLWVQDIDVSGSITGGSFATTTLNNLGTTAINASLLLDTDNSYNLGSLSKELSGAFATDFSAGTSARGGLVSIYNGVSATPNILAGTNVTGNSDIQVGALFQTGWAFYPLANNVGDLGTTGRGWRNLFVNAITVLGNAGLSVTKTVRAAGGAADCTLIYTAGVLTGGTC